MREKNQSFYVRIISKCKEKNIRLPKMLKLSVEKDLDSFYKDNEHLTIEGTYKKIDTI